jgi:hypothetical protein
LLPVIAAPVVRSAQVNATLGPVTEFFTVAPSFFWAKVTLDSSRTTNTVQFTILIMILLVGDHRQFDVFGSVKIFQSVFDVEQAEDVFHSGPRQSQDASN